jgi:hypothetical protein
MSATTSKGPPIAVPNAFSGDRTLTDKFIYECQLYVQGKPNEFDNGVDKEQQKIIFMLSYMNKGLASNWAQRYQTREYEADTNKYDPQRHRCKTFDEFIKQVNNAFKEHNPGESARARLDLLHQGNNSVDSYSEIFMDLGVKSGYDEAALRHLYIKGLRHDIQNQIMLMAEIPTTLGALQDKATEFDLRRNTFNRRMFFPTSTPSEIALGSRENPINIDRTFVQRSLEEIKQLKTDQKCFICKQTGHIARNCRNREGNNNLEGYTRPNTWMRGPMRARNANVQDTISHFIASASTDELNQMAMACKDAERSAESIRTQDF